MTWTDQLHIVGWRSWIASLEVAVDDDRDHDQPEAGDDLPAAFTHDTPELEPGEA